MKQESIPNPPFPTDFGGKFISSTWKENEKVIFAPQPYHQLIVCMEGCYHLTYSDFPPCKLQKGEMITISRLVAHSGWAEGNLHLLILPLINLAETYDKWMIQALNTCKSAVNYSFRPTPVRDLLSGYTRVISGCLEQGINDIRLQELQLHELLCCIKWLYSTEEISYLFYEQINQTFEFRKFILDNYMRVNNLNELIKLSAMSRSVFYRKFRAEFNETAHCWIQKHTCRQILQQLSQDIAIKEVMLRMGFSSFSNFNRFCKLKFGCSPTELVEKLRQHSLHEKL